MGTFVCASAVRGAEPRAVLAAVASYFDGLDVATEPRAGDPQSDDLKVYDASNGWTTVLWPQYFLPLHDHAAQALSRGLDTLVSSTYTADSDGWAHFVHLSGTLIDKFHSWPAVLAWEQEEVPRLAVEWSGDPGLVAGVFGVEQEAIRRFFAQAGPDDEDHPGIDGWGFVELWEALGITYPVGEVELAAVLQVDQSWRQVQAAESD